MAKRKYAVLHEDIFGNVTNLGTAKSRKQADEMDLAFRKKRSMWG